MFFRKKIQLGVDLGQHSLKVAAVEAQGSRIQGLWQCPLYPDRSTQRDRLEGPELERRVQELLEKCQQKLPSWSRDVATSVRGKGVMCGYLELPQLSPAELKIAVPTQVTKKVPYDLKELIVNYLPVPPIEGSGKTAVFYVAVLSSAVAKIRHLLDKCGLNVTTMSAAPLALVAEFNKNCSHEVAGVRALVSVGFETTQVIFMVDGHPYHFREFALAGRDFTYAFQMGAQSSWQDAEQYKLAYDLRRRESAIEAFMLRWLDQLQRSFKDFQRRFPTCPPCEQLYLCGGGAAWTGLPERIFEVLAIPVACSRWERLKIQANKEFLDQASTFKIAVGLALAG